MQCSRELDLKSEPRLMEVLDGRRLRLSPTLRLPYLTCLAQPVTDTEFSFLLLGGGMIDDCGKAEREAAPIEGRWIAVLRARTQWECDSRINQEIKLLLHVIIINCHNTCVLGSSSPLMIIVSLSFPELILVCVDVM